MAESRSSDSYPGSGGLANPFACSWSDRRASLGAPGPGRRPRRRRI